MRCAIQFGGSPAGCKLIYINKVNVMGIFRWFEESVENLFRWFVAFVCYVVRFIKRGIKWTSM